MVSASTDDWLAVPEPRHPAIRDQVRRRRRNSTAKAQPPPAEPGESERPQGEFESSAEPVQAALDELRRRIEATEAKVRGAQEAAAEAERRAIEAAARAEEAIERQRQLRGELALARPPSRDVSEEEPPPETNGRSGDEFPDLAQQVEERVKEIERRVASAGQMVEELTSTASSRPIPAQGPATAAPPLAPAHDELTPTQEEPESRGLLENLLDINRASFEQLRELGLSVTEAARVLARRDARGRFTSLDELNDLVGFSRELIEKLRSRLSLG